jgi:hypothetical protein
MMTPRKRSADLDDFMSGCLCQPQKFAGQSIGGLKEIRRSGPFPRDFIPDVALGVIDPDSVKAFRQSR